MSHGMVHFVCRNIFINFCISFNLLQLSTINHQSDLNSTLINQKPKKTPPPWTSSIGFPPESSPSVCGRFDYPSQAWSWMLLKMSALSRPGHSLSIMALLSCSSQPYLTNTLEMGRETDIFSFVWSGKSLGVLSGWTRTWKSCIWIDSNMICK